MILRRYLFGFAKQRWGGKHNAQDISERRAVVSEQTRDSEGDKREGTKTKGQEEEKEKVGSTTVLEAAEAVSLGADNPELAQMALQEKVWMFGVIGGLTRTRDVIAPCPCPLSHMTP